MYHISGGAMSAGSDGWEESLEDFAEDVVLFWLDVVLLTEGDVVLIDCILANAAIGVSHKTPLQPKLVVKLVRLGYFY